MPPWFKAGDCKKTRGEKGTSTLWINLFQNQTETHKECLIWVDRDTVMQLKIWCKQNIRVLRLFVYTRDLAHAHENKTFCPTPQPAKNFLSGTFPGNSRPIRVLYGRIKQTLNRN